MLIVGRLEKTLVDLADLMLPAHQQADKKAPWRTAPDDIAILDNLNLASVCLFNNHIAGLEGISTESAVTKSRFPNVPRWCTSIWLPISFPLPKGPPSESGGWPVFVGSTMALLEELREIQKLSPMKLGETPDGYELMRTNPKKFYQLETNIEGDMAVIQWVWRALFDAATISFEKQAPLLGAFD